jgi:hypothetical protein
MFPNLNGVAIDITIGYWQIKAECERFSSSK